MDSGWTPVYSSGFSFCSIATILFYCNLQQGQIAFLLLICPSNCCTAGTVQVRGAAFRNLLSPAGTKKGTLMSEERLDHIEARLAKLEAAAQRKRSRRPPPDDALANNPAEILRRIKVAYRLCEIGHAPESSQRAIEIYEKMGGPPVTS